MRRERSFPTKREARERLAAQDTDAKRGVWTDPNAGRETFAAVADLWLEAHSYQVAPKTRDNNISMLRCHLLPEFAEPPLKALPRDAWTDARVATVRSAAINNSQIRYANVPEDGEWISTPDAVEAHFGALGIEPPF